MKTNALPRYAVSASPTACCPKFKPEDWDGKSLHFKNKLFLKADTMSIFHIPINIDSVYKKVMSDIEQDHAFSEDDFVVLSYDPSPWRSEHYFAINKPIPGYEMSRLSGDYLCKVFEGSYSHMPQWLKEARNWVEELGYKAIKTYLFYSTCPKCAKIYGKNYVVAISEVELAKEDEKQMLTDSAV